MFTKHYRYLHRELVKTDEDEDTFNDTFLKLTYNYDPDKDFVEQYKYYFNLLKGAYQRADKVEQYRISSIEGFDVADLVSEEEPVGDKKTKFSELKNSIHNAVHKEANKRKGKTGK